MQTNVFLNSYKKKEDELTYAFFSMLELLNSRNLYSFLSGEELSIEPFVGMRVLPVGHSTNPDGEISLVKQDGTEFKLLFENKTKIRGLDKGQLLGHLELCLPHDRLLVVTPRKSDLRIVHEIHDERIVFHTWGEVATELLSNHPSNPLVVQFIEYGRISGQFEELGEIAHYDIETYIQSLSVRFEHRMNTILAYLFEDISSAESSLPVPENDIWFGDKTWGRHGIEIGERTCQTRTYGQWYFIGYYHDPTDHGIPFKKGIPEIALFFDVKPDLRPALVADAPFCNAVRALVDLGFEHNLDGKASENQWRLFFRRIPIDEFDVLNAAQLRDFLEKSFDTIDSVGLSTHAFSELGKN